MKELMHKKEVFLGFELSPVCSSISMLSEFLIFFRFCSVLEAHVLPFLFQLIFHRIQWKTLLNQILSSCQNQYDKSKGHQGMLNLTVPPRNAEIFSNNSIGTNSTVGPSAFLRRLICFRYIIGQRKCGKWLGCHLLGLEKKWILEIF